MYEPRPSDVTLPPTEPLHIVLPSPGHTPSDEDRDDFDVTASAVSSTRT